MNEYELIEENAIYIYKKDYQNDDEHVDYFYIKLLFPTFIFNKKMIESSYYGEYFKTEITFPTEFYFIRESNKPNIFWNCKFQILGLGIETIRQRGY